MKKIIAFLIITGIIVSVTAIGTVIAKKNGCVTIQNRIIEYSTGHYLEGEPLMIGYDSYGYNYQAHMFNGSVANVYLGRYGYPPYDPANEEEYVEANPDVVNVWCWPYRNTELVMWWNDAWLSNKNCDEDGKLDRHYGYDTYIGSSAWLTNHEKGTYINDTGEICSYNYFCKIVAAPADATATDGTWYTADGTEIGPVIWGAFAIIQEVEKDSCAGLHGLQYGSPTAPGFGVY